MDNTIIQQGEFVSNQQDKIIVLRSDVDWMTVVNWTQSVATNADYGCHYYWQRGMADGLGLVYHHPAADATLGVQACAAGAGFTLIDTTDQAPGAARAVTATQNAVNPIIAAANTAGLAIGSIVRLSGTVGTESLCGWDFQVGAVTDGVDFTMAYNMATAPGLVGGAGFYRVIPYDPIFYPRWRYIINITAAANAVIHTSVDHGLTVGQTIRVKLQDDNFGMTEIDGLEGTVTAVTAGTITTDIDSSGFTAFTFALPANLPFTMPTVVPIGMDTAAALEGAVGLLEDATKNTGYIGIRLHVGTVANPNEGSLSPAGHLNDVIKWRAGKSFSDLDET